MSAVEGRRHNSLEAEQRGHLQLPEAIRDDVRQEELSTSVKSSYHTLYIYPLYTFFTICTPMYTRHTCIYTIYTPLYISKHL